MPYTAHSSRTRSGIHASRTRRALIDSSEPNTCGPCLACNERTPFSLPQKRCSRNMKHMRQIFYRKHCTRGQNAVPIFMRDNEVLMQHELNSPTVDLVRRVAQDKLNQLPMVQPNGPSGEHGLYIHAVDTVRMAEVMKQDPACGKQLNTSSQPDTTPACRDARRLPATRTSSTKSAPALTAPPSVVSRHVHQMLRRA